jgi:hypothetical protein
LKKWLNDLLKIEFSKGEKNSVFSNLKKQHTLAAIAVGALM